MRLLFVLFVCSFITQARFIIDTFVGLLALAERINLHSHYVLLEAINSIPLPVKALNTQTDSTAFISARH